MKTKILSSLLVVLCLTEYRAQDIHFSQFSEQLSLINPALTGATAPSRASIAYRNQWRSVTTPYVTSGASFETRFNASSWEQADKHKSMTFKERSGGRFAAGISIYKDNAGDGNMGQTLANLSLASFIQTGKKSFVSLGLQASMVQRKLNSSELIFPNQYNGSGYDAGMSSGETFQNTNNTNADFAAGIVWSYGQNDKSILGKRQLKINLGFSTYHFNRPKQTFFLVSKNDRSLKFVTHGDMLLTLANPDFAISPAYLLQFRGSSKEILAGMMVKRYIDMTSKYTGILKRSYLGFGLYLRNQDAAILSVALEIKEQINIGVSYDLNVSRLRNSTNARGGFELTMRYTPPSSFLYQRKKDG